MSDIRNTRVVDLIEALRAYGVRMEIYDPMADQKEMRREYGIEISNEMKKFKADAIVIAVAHEAFRKYFDLRSLKAHLIFTRGQAVVIDVKGMYRPDQFANSGILHWRL